MITNLITQGNGFKDSDLISDWFNRVMMILTRIHFPMFLLICSQTKILIRRKAEQYRIQGLDNRLRLL
jgi:hypothetical protein